MKIAIYLSFLLVAVAADYTADGLEYASPPSQAEKFEPFPKTIWILQDSGLNNAPVYKKLTVNNINHYAKLSGFDFRFITSQNYTEFLSADTNSRLKKLLSSLKDQSNTGKFDILRAFLIYQNGGIWTDATSYLLEGLQWVQNLYKLPGVYNRFFPNPNVLFFTKNKDYSGNKTKVIDQKTQQQVYLFPGMENWFTIAKPKSQYYNDLLAALERYCQVGRDKILQESKNLGIKYGEQLNPYFDKSYLQLQYVLQKKQKELDALKDPPTKYAVQYYKMWFLSLQYTGFLFYVNVEGDQEIQFQFQYSEEMLGSLYGFQLQPHFIKNLDWVATGVDKVLQKIAYSQNCLSAKNTLQPQSLIYRHLINITSMFKQIDDIKQTFGLFQGKCNPVGQKVSTIKNSLQTVKAIILAIFLSIPALGISRYILKILETAKQKKIKFDK